MIRAILYEKSTHNFTKGNEELLDVWLNDPTKLIWVDLANNPLEDEQVLLKKYFNLHPLAIQDAQRDRHPPKLEAFNNHTFILLKGLSADSENIKFSTIQLAIFIGERFMLTRHSDKSPSADRLFAEFENNISNYMQGTDKLAMGLCRILVGRYLNILLALEPRLVELEDEIMKHPRDTILSEIIGYKTNLKQFRRIFLYHEQLFRELKSKPFKGITKDSAHELNDVYEHQERACSLTELYYELASDLIDGYISVASHHLNQIMKVLTVVMAIFVPLSFLAGIYGMNFENMPELHSRSGYFILLGIMAFIAVLLLTFFRKKRWL